MGNRPPTPSKETRHERRAQRLLRRSRFPFEARHAPNRSNLRSAACLTIQVFVLSPAAKPAVWMASSRRDVRAFPDDARLRVGYELFRVQMGLEPTNWKPMRSMGVGVREIRIRTGSEHRLLYVAGFAEALYVLHAFEKKTQRTTNPDLDLARSRYRELIALRCGQETSTRKK